MKEPWYKEVSQTRWIQGGIPLLVPFIHFVFVFLCRGMGSPPLWRRIMLPGSGPCYEAWTHIFLERFLFNLVKLWAFLDYSLLPYWRSVNIGPWLPSVGWVSGANTPKRLSALLFLQWLDPLPIFLLFLPFQVLLRLPLRLLSGFICAFSREQQVETSLCHLVQTRKDSEFAVTF